MNSLAFDQSVDQGIQLRMEMDGSWKGNQFSWDALWSAPKIASLLGGFFSLPYSPYILPFCRCLRDEQTSPQAPPEDDLSGDLGTGEC